VLIYVIVVGIWIPFSDILIGVFIKDPTILTYMKVFKDYSYVMTTAWILYTLMNKNMEAIERSKKALLKINIKLRHEIAERQQIEAALRKTEEEKEVILDSMSECVVYLDTNKGVLWTNRAASETLGLNLMNFTKAECKDIWGHDEQWCKNCPVEEVIQSGRPEEKVLTTVDGRTWLLKIYPVVDKEVKNIVLVGLEITEQQRAGEERMRLVTAVEQAAEAIVITDSDGIIKYVNPAFEKITGYTSNDVVEKNARILKSGQHDRTFYKYVE
jgi:PAS domain-containing protein